MIYVRHPHRDTWHWNANCSSVAWSLKQSKKGGLVVQDVPGGKRPRGELCNQCKAKQRRGTGEPIA